MTSFQKILIRRGMAVLLALSAGLARHPALRPLSFAWSRLLAGGIIRRKRIRQAADLSGLGQAWQRGFPAAKQVPLEQVTEDTVYARIETPCPLRGSGRTAACWRMMEYDRLVAQAAGGQFIILESQAEAGVTTCRVALRWAGAAIDDLTPAHIRKPG